jgi:hypothetical protein
MVPKAMMEGARDPPVAGKRRRGALAVVFLAALPLLLVLFLFGDRAASIAADTQLWSQVKQQSMIDTYYFSSAKYSYLSHPCLPDAVR